MNHSWIFQYVNFVKTFFNSSTHNTNGRHSKGNSMAYFWITNLSWPIIPNVWLGYIEKCSFVCFSKHYSCNGQPRARQRTFEISTPFLFHNAITALLCGSFSLTFALWCCSLTNNSGSLKTDATLWWTRRIK